MIRLTVSRNDSIYECFPDVGRTPEGTLVCVYRESMGHGPQPTEIVRSIERIVAHSKSVRWVEND